VLRRFYSPPLDPGKGYAYTLVARWEPNNYVTITRTRKVPVEAGKTVEVDLSVKDPKHPDDIVIRYVPTPEEVVDAMLRLGKVGKDDVVWDLGCGDGRIPIAAVTRFKAKRGVGIDIDPQRIREARANLARAGGAEGKVEFRQGDVLKIKDFSEASVVTLYMSNDLNEAVRPVLQKTLKPGSRIVSHRFLLGDWKPDRTESLVVDGEVYYIHLWTVK
jgi:precorrin-6B methylase 2